MASAGMIAACAVGGSMAVWLSIADGNMRQITRESMDLRHRLMTDPATTIHELCRDTASPVAHLGVVRLPPWTGGGPLSCEATLLHRSRRESSGEQSPGSASHWTPADCKLPFGGYLEPVRFRQIRVCCSRDGQGCLFKWRFFMKS